LWTWEGAVFTKAIVTRGTGTAGVLYSCGNAIGSILQCDAVADTYMLHIIANFDNFPNNLVTRIGVAVTGDGRGCNCEISIGKDKAEVAATDTGERIAYAHPVRCRKRLSW
jgi:hypothetical protein